MKKDTMLLFIPNEGRTYVEGCINGQNFRIKTGEPVEVPKNIAEVIIESQRAIGVDKRSIDAFKKAGGKRIM